MSIWMMGFKENHEEDYWFSGDQKIWFVDGEIQHKIVYDPAYLNDAIAMRYFPTYSMLLDYLTTEMHKQEVGMKLTK